ncbi:MAG: glycosyltransferase, partial [Planctomycetota bacterium]|nr:glycosyltransferase [Planctomycetota bacterium]
MDEADVFLQCSVTGADGDCEGIPNVVVEASATGLPVLGTRHGGIVEPVQNERTGLLVAERDVPAMIEALRRLLTRRDERLALGATGAKIMRADWNLDRQVAQHLEIYRRLDAERNSDQGHAKQVFIPAGFHELAANAIQFKGNAKEFSLAELAQLLFSGERLNLGDMDRDRGFMERLYDLKRFVPQPVKFPAKVLLGKLLSVLLELKYHGYGSTRASWTELRRQLDERVLDFVGEGGEVSAIESGWSVGDLQRLLSRQHHPKPGENQPEPEPLEPSRAP